MLADASVVHLEKTNRGGMLRDGVYPAAADSAVAHLNEALQLAPTDLSLHQGRLAIWIRAGRYTQADSALAKSLRLLQPTTDVELWLPYGARMFYADQYDAALQYMTTLSRFYPDDHRVVANIGAMLTMLERDEEALPYVERAVELNPEDPINNWNLARLYMFLDRLEEADTYYRRALDLDDGNTAEGRERSCLYADFVAEKLEEEERAHSIRQASCKAQR